MTATGVVADSTMIPRSSFDFDAVGGVEKDMRRPAIGQCVLHTGSLFRSDSSPPLLYRVQSLRTHI